MITVLTRRRPVAAAYGSGRNGAGARLNEMERRVEVLGREIRETMETRIEIKTRTESPATKEDVLRARNDMLKWGVGFIVPMLISVVGHRLLRTL